MDLSGYGLRCCGSFGTDIIHNFNIDLQTPLLMSQDDLNIDNWMAHLAVMLTNYWHHAEARSTNVND